MVVCKYCKRTGHHITVCKRTTCKMCYDKGHLATSCPLAYVPRAWPPDSFYRMGEQHALCVICNVKGHYSHLCGEYVRLSDSEKKRIFKLFFL